MADDHLQRAITEEFKNKVRAGKVLILLGPRRVGKTALIHAYIKTQKTSDYLLLNGDDQAALDVLSERTVVNYQRLLKGVKLLVIDEAQQVPDIGLKLKLIVDTIPDVAVIATGSSVFDLGNKLGEPLVGRSNTLRLYPLAQMEFGVKENYLQTKEKLDERLIFGSYPELEKYGSWEEKSEYLEGLVNDYLLKDILEYEGIRKSGKIMDLLRLIAFQVGKEVSLDELAKGLKGISRNTVELYLDLLSKVFVIYNVRGFSRNLRKEITKTSRWYFYDNGIRNTIIRNLNPLNFRNDIGELWENYLMAERRKYNAYTRRRVNSYFWRTYDQQEIDLVEEKGVVLNAFEFKWNESRKVKEPGGWQSGYPDATFEVITPQNYLEFIVGE